MRNVRGSSLMQSSHLLANQNYTVFRISRISKINKLATQLVSKSIVTSQVLPNTMRNKLNMKIMFHPPL